MTDLQQGNRGERRRLQRSASKKLRKEEKKLMKSAPNGEKYNPKKSRKIAPLDSNVNNKKKREFIIIEEVYDAPAGHYNAYKPAEEDVTKTATIDDFAGEETANNAENALDNGISEEIKAPERENLTEKEQSIFIKEPSIIIAEPNLTSIPEEAIDDGLKNQQIVVLDSDVKNVTVTEVPVLNDETVDVDIKNNDETTTVETVTSQEKKEEEDTEKEEEQLVMNIFNNTPIEDVEKTALPAVTLEEVVPTPSISDRTIPVSFEVITTSPQMNNDKQEVEQFTMYNNNSSIILHDNKTDQSTLNDATIATPSVSVRSVPSRSTSTSSSRKRSIISRLFKNNRIEIKQKPQEKVITIAPEPEKKKVKSWQIWKKL